VTQPALSMQIQELEGAIGVQLVERRAKGLRLTDDGREIARRAARILSDTRDLVDYARRRVGLLAGPLRLGVIPSVAPYLLPPLLPMLKENYPQLELHIRETQTDQLVRMLQNGSLDLLLLALPIDNPEVETIKLFEDRFVLAVPQDRELHNWVRATPDLVRQDRLLLLEEGHCFRDQALAFCQLRKLDSIDTFGASSLSTLVQMVASGLGLTLLPEISLDLEASRAKVRLIRFADPEPYRVLGLAWRSTSPRKRDFVELGKLVVATAGQRQPASDL